MSGKLGSYPLEDLVARARSAIADGVSEIWLSSEDTGTCVRLFLFMGARSPHNYFPRGLDQQQPHTHVTMNVGAYGIDRGTSLSELLRRLTRELEGSDVMMRLGMTNPPFILAQLDAVAEALEHPNVFAFLHVPVQSGSDQVLSNMNRE